MINKKYNLIGCCGISCGLCPRYQSKAESRCLGCGPDAHCTYCSIFKCCTVRKNHETCADCPEFPCEKFNKWFDGDSFVTHRKCCTNLENIKKAGISVFLKELKERKRILEIMLEKYNPGRCISLYCLASALMSIESLNSAMKQIANVKTDKKQSFRKMIKELAEKNNISLKLRK